MRTLVIYYSKTGFAKRYAQWLEEDLACRCVPFSQQDSVDLAAYDKVVFGSSVHAGGHPQAGVVQKAAAPAAGASGWRCFHRGHASRGAPWSSAWPRT